MEILEVDLKKVSNFGGDGAKISTSKFIRKKCGLFYKKDKELRMDKLKLRYQDNRKECYTVEYDYESRKLVIKFSFPLFTNEHNLYFTDPANIKILLKKIKKQLRSYGIIIFIDKLDFEDLEYGTNFKFSSLDSKDMVTFEYIAAALNRNYKKFYKAVTKPYIKNIGQMQTLFNSRGYSRFKIYSKHIEMAERKKVYLDVNVVRLEFQLSKNELIKLIGTSNVLKVLESIFRIYTTKIKKMFKNLREFEKRLEKEVNKEIIQFKKDKKIGLMKHILSTFNFIDKKILISALEKNKKVTNYNFCTYLKQIEEKKIGDVSKFEFIKNQIMDNFFHLGFIISKCSEKGWESIIDTRKISLQSICSIIEKLENTCISKIENFSKYLHEEVLL